MVSGWNLEQVYNPENSNDSGDSSMTREKGLTEKIMPNVRLILAKNNHLFGRSDGFSLNVSIPLCLVNVLY
jgi:hypothetical protein